MIKYNHFIQWYNLISVIIQLDNNQRVRTNNIYLTNYLEHLCVANNNIMQYLSTSYLHDNLTKRLSTTFNFYCLTYFTI